MDFEEGCKWLVDNARPQKELPYEQCSFKEKSRRINSMFNDIAIKNSTKTTLDRIYKR